MMWMFNDNKNNEQKTIKLTRIKTMKQEQVVFITGGDIVCWKLET